MVSVGVNFGLDLAEEITALKRERKAVILAHNYQVPEIQDVADFVGDSLGLSLSGREDRRRGHRFLRRPFHGRDGENSQPDQDSHPARPGRRLLPVRIVPAGKAGAVPQQHADKNYYVIAYINCSAGVKALSDVICTSGNAEKIVRAARPIATSSSCPTKISAPG